MNLLLLISLLLSIFQNTSIVNTDLNKLHLLVDNNKEASQDVLAAFDPFYEDDTPADPIVEDSPAVASQANATDALPDTTVSSSIANSISKPNVVVIMLDDINPVDGRLWNSSLTPNINSLFVDEGINFTNYFGETSLCCPGRVGFLTGQHTQNHGVGDLDGTKFKPKDTVATELQSKGYYTMLVGKYINFYDRIPASRAIPPGWTKFDALHTGNGKYFNYNIISKNGSSYTRKYYGATATDYSTDVETNIAVKRIKEAPSNKPIFAYIAPTAAHGDWTPAPRHANTTKCDNLYWKPPSYAEDVSDKPSYVSRLTGGDSAAGHSLTKYCKTLLSVDEMVGRVKKALNSTGRLSNTLFVFTADNGMSWGEHRLTMKTTPYSTRLPLYITWPAMRGRTPVNNDTTLMNIDFGATFCEIAGCVMGPYPNGQKTSDGLSFLPLIKGKTVSWRRDAVLESQPIKPTGQAAPEDRPAWWAVRTTETNPLGMWHYVEYNNGEKELYDLSNGPCYAWNSTMTGDPCELNNLLSSDAPVPADENLVLALKSQLLTLKAQKGLLSSLTPTPTITPTYTPTPTLTQIENGTIISSVKTYTKSITAVSDAHVRSDIPGSNYGGSTQIRADGSPTFITYLKLDLTSFKGKTVTNAILKLTVANITDANSALSEGLSFYSISASWGENTVTYNNRPANGTLLGTVTGAKAQNEVASVDLTNFIKQNVGKVVSISIVNTGPDAIMFNSREASSNKPSLTVTYK